MTKIHHPEHFKLGRRPPRLDARTLRFSTYLNVKGLPVPPAIQDWGAKVTDWGMMKNDTLGDCVLENTQVHVPNMKRAYRSKYNGPAIRILMASGKRLSVTPNHLVFTPGGAIAAKLIKEGDYLVGTSRPEILPNLSLGGGKAHINQAPAFVQEKFATARFEAGPIREVMPAPVNFHGDAQFFDGNVDVVSANSFLGSEYNASLREPHTKAKVGTAGQLQRHFHSFSSTLQRRLTSLSAALGDICSGSLGPAFRYTHAGITQSYSLPQRTSLVPRSKDSFFQAAGSNSKIFTDFLHSFSSQIPFDSRSQIPVTSRRRDSAGFCCRSEFYASGNDVSDDSLDIDARFISNLLSAFPGVVAPDRVVNVEFGSFSGHVYDFSTEQNWYIADGLITHNCTCAAVGHMVLMDTSLKGKPFRPSDNDIVKLYSAVSGYDPADPSSDQGAVELDVLKYWRTSGLDGHKITAFVSINVHNLSLMRAAIWLFGGVYTGVALPETAQDQDEWDMTPNGLMGPGVPGSWGGHAVPIVGYDDKSFTCVTWGQPKKLTAAWWANYGEEAYAVIGDDWCLPNGCAPNNFNIVQLMQDLKAV